MDVNGRLIKERDLLRTIIDNLPDYIYAKDCEGRFLLNNPAHARDLGAASPQAMLGKTDFDFFPRELAEQFFADEQKIIASGGSLINQEQYKASPGDKNGERRWSLSSKVVWRSDDGSILGTVGITRDIHEFKLTQEALRRSETVCMPSCAGRVASSILARSRRTGRLAANRRWSRFAIPLEYPRSKTWRRAGGFPRGFAGGEILPALPG